MIPTKVMLCQLYLMLRVSNIFALQNFAIRFFFGSTNIWYLTSAARRVKPTSWWDLQNLQTRWRQENLQWKMPCFQRSPPSGSRRSSSLLTKWYIANPHQAPVQWGFQNYLSWTSRKDLERWRPKSEKSHTEQNCVTLVTVTSAQEQNHLKTSFILCTQRSKGQPKILKAVVWLKHGRLSIFSEGTVCMCVRIWGMRWWLFCSQLFIHRPSLGA